MVHLPDVKVHSCQLRSSGVEAVFGLVVSNSSDSAPDTG